MNKVFDCRLVELPKIKNRVGNITVIDHQEISIPFDVKRVYYLYDIPGGESRGAHGHKELEQLVIAASGSFDINLDDGTNKKTFTLSQPYVGLHIVPGIWRDINNFSSGSICLVLASHEYDEKDYIRDYWEFQQWKKI